MGEKKRTNKKPLDRPTPAPQKEEKRKKAITLNLILTVVFIIFTYWIMAVKNGFMLRWYDEMSLFEPNYFFFRRFLYYPGGLLRYAGTYLTQLMYYPFLGTTALLILWLLTAWLSRITFKLKGAAWPLALIVPITLLVSVVQLDESWLTLKSEGYLFFPTLGYLFTISAFYLFQKGEKYKALSFAISILIVLCYFIAGFYALLAGVLCIISYISKGLKSRREQLLKSNKNGKADRKERVDYISFIEAVVVSAFIFALPKLYYVYFQGNTVDNDFPYLKGLPELMMEKYDLYLWVPFIIATAIIIIYGVVYNLGIKRISESGFVKWLGVTGCVGFGIWGVVAEDKSEQFMATVLMLEKAEKNDWKGVTNIMSLIREPANYTMLVINNLAVVKMGGEPLSVAGFKPEKGNGRKAEAFTVTAFMQVPVNYYIGRLNQSYRWAMEHTIQYGKRVFFLKYMVKDMLLRGEIKVAKRYNDILMSTMFHRKWAEEMNKYIENPSLIEKNPEFKDVLEKREIEKRREG